MEDRLWYIVQTYSGFENTVAENLEKRIETMDMEDYIFRVLVPEEKYIEEKNGKEKEIIKKLFPGYVFIEMIVTDKSWYIVRNTPGVTGFLGSSGKGAKPVPISKSEIDAVLKHVDGAKVEEEIDLNIGDKVTVCEGPFEGQIGTIEEIDEAKRLVQVLVEFFGRATPVELAVDKVEKV